jgi:adenylate cyclase
VEALEVPYSVHAVLSARIDRLPDREKQVLQKAAVIGKEFRETILAAVAKLPAADLGDSLAALCNGEFIHQQSLYPIAEYAFAHPLTQEVALGSQLHEQRRRIHADVARATQEGEPEKLDENAALLAHHYEEAGEPLEAARYHARAATWVGTKDLDGTLRHWQRVRELVRALPEDQEAAGLRLLACLQILVMGGFRLGLSEAAVDEIYEEGSRLAERAGNLAIVTTLRAAYGARLVGLGRVREYFDLTMESVQMAEQVGIPAIRAGTCVAAVYASYMVGHLAECARHIEAGAEIIGSDLEAGRREFGFSYLVFLMTARAGLLGVMGRLEESRRELVNALRVARDSGVAENLGWTLGNLGIRAELTGDLLSDGLGDARAGVLESLRIAEDLGSGFSRAAAYANMGSAHLAAAEWQEAERFLAESLDLARMRRIGLEHEAATLAHLARAQLGKGSIAAARATAEEAVALAVERGQRLWELLAQVVLAEALCAEQGARAGVAIEQVLQRADDLVEETGGRAYEPRIAEVRARIGKAGGDAGAGDLHLREAHRLYTEIGATGHARRVAQELAGG